mgnify:CR=1 FL=1
MMQPNEVVKVAAKALSDKKGKDIKVLKTDKLTTLCDYFVICTGTSSTHIKSLTDELDKQMSPCAVRVSAPATGCCSISVAWWLMYSPRTQEISISSKDSGPMPRRSISHPL